MADDLNVYELRPEWRHLASPGFVLRAAERPLVEPRYLAWRGTGCLVGSPEDLARLDPEADGCCAACGQMLVFGLELVAYVDRVGAVHQSCPLPEKRI